MRQYVGNTCAIRELNPIIFKLKRKTPSKLQKQGETFKF